MHGHLNVKLHSKTTRAYLIVYIIYVNVGMVPQIRPRQRC